MNRHFLLAFGSVAALAIGLPAQTNPRDLLIRLREKVMDSVENMPRFMCTQTIDRSVYLTAAHRGVLCKPDPKQRRLYSSDRLRMDVAMGKNQEMYSWIGESHFNDGDLVEMVNQGAISSGSFAAFLANIFGSGAATFTDDGLRGLTLWEFGFKVPVEKSTYHFGSRERRPLTGYSGTFLADPAAVDLLKLNLRTDSLPSETGMCYAETALDYMRVRLADAEFLLPKESRLHIVLNGGEAENRTVFSGCHEFLGESAITFDAPGTVPATAPQHTPRAPSPPIVIPPRLPFEVALTQGIDTSSAAGGDPLKAQLLAPIKNGDQVLVPAGAAVGARIVSIQQFHDKKPRVVVDIKLETVTVGGVEMRLHASPEASSFQKAKPGGLQARVRLGTIASLRSRTVAFEFEMPRQPYLIATGLESAWVTGNP